MLKLRLKIDKQHNPKDNVNISKGKVVRLKDNLHVLFKGVTYDILIDNKTFKVLYSTPLNNKYEEYTKKILTKAIGLNEQVAVMWTPLFPGKKVKGRVENNKFIIRL